MSVEGVGKGVEKCVRVWKGLGKEIGGGMGRGKK